MGQLLDALPSLLADLRAARERLAWLPIETYPREKDLSGHDWGMPALMLSDGHPFVGHLEADMWLWRAPDDPDTFSHFLHKPTHWMPLPGPPENERD